MRAASIGLMAAVALALTGAATAAEPAGKKKESAMVSLVFLLKEPRTLDLDDVRKRFGAAIGQAFTEDPNSKNFLVHFEGPMHGMLVDGKRYGLIHVPKPYVSDPKASAKQATEVRLKAALREHKAWLAIDSFDDTSTEALKADAYRTIAKLMVTLAGDDVLAVFSPETDLLVWYDESVLAKLKGKNPLDALKWEDPVIDVPNDDPEMVAAVKKARETFPEFAKSFASPKAGQYFAVKGHFGPKGKGEYMRVKVAAINDGVVTGTLDNRPGRLPELKAGDRVEVKVTELNDWLIVEADKKTKTGGYTLDVVEKHMMKNSPKGKAGEK